MAQRIVEPIPSTYPPVKEEEEVLKTVPTPEPVPLRNMSPIVSPVIKKPRVVEPIKNRYEINREQMLSQPETMGIVRDYLINRKGTQWSERSDEEAVDAFIKHMRWINTNEVYTIGELRHAIASDDISKERIRKAYNVYDTLSNILENGDTSEALGGMWDYTKAVLASPSTWLGGFIGSKLATKAVTEGTKKIIMKNAIQEALKGGGQAAANEVIKSATKAKVATAVILGTLTDSGASTLQDYAYQLSRIEVGAQDKYDPVQGVISTLGGLAGGAAAYIPSAARGLSGMEGAAMKMGAAKELRKIAAKKVAVPKLQKSVKKLATNLKEWQDQLKDGKLGLKNTTEEMLNRVGWFFDIDDPDSITRIVIDSGADINFDARFTEEINNFARSLDQKTINAFNKVLKPTGVKFGQFLDQMAVAESSAGQALSRASKAKKYAQNFLLQSVANTKLDRSIVGTMVDDLGLPDEGYIGPEYARYAASLWRRALVSHPTTTALNVIGWSQAFGAKTIAEMLHGGSLGLAGYAGKMFNKDWGNKQLARSRALWQNQIYKTKMLLDPYSTVEAFHDMVEQLPKNIRRLADRSYFGGVDGTTSTEIYRMNPDNWFVKNAEKVSDIASTATFVKAQDVVTKAFSGLADLDRLSRLHYGRGIDDLLAKGETNLLTEDMWKTAILNMQKDTFSVDHTKAKGTLNKFAGLIEDISNAPYIGFLFPFGRFMNSSLGFMMEYSPLGLISVASKIYNNKAFTYTAQEKLARTVVGSVALATLFSASREHEKRGLQYSQVEDSTGTIRNRSNVAPESMYRIVSKMSELYSRGEGIPPEMWKELGNVMGPGQWSRQLTQGNALNDMIAALSSTSTSDEDRAEVMGVINTIMSGDLGPLAKGVSKTVGGIAAGFTRPIEPFNKFTGMALENDPAIDRRQASTLSEVMTQELTRYTNSIFAPLLGTAETEQGIPTIGVPKRAATRPEGDIHDPNPFASLLARKEEPAFNNIDRVLGMVNLPAFIMDKRTAVPELDHFLNKEVAPILNRRAKILLDDPRWRNAPQYIKVNQVREMLSEVREEVIQNLGEGSIGGYEDRLNDERRRWTGTYSLAEREMARRELGITTSDKELSRIQLEVMKEYIKNKKDFLEHIRQ